MVERRTSRDYGHPARPVPVRLLNQVVRRTGVGRASLDPEDLLAAAVRAEGGLTHLGDPDPMPPLRRLVRSIEDEADLHPLGRWITRIRLVDALRARLRIERFVQDHPGADTTPLPDTILVVAGLQRTGTTLLQRLLAAAPGARALASWEALNPVPFRTGRDPEARVAHAVRSARALRWLAPDFFAVHPVDPLEPEEDVLLMELTFLSTVSEATLRVPSWSRWLEAQDQTPAYRFLRRTLRVLQYQRPGTHWVLKTPHHLEWIDTLLAVFPEARVVMTHRDPCDTQASFSSMVAHGRGLTSDNVDPVEIGAEWLRKCHRLLARALDARGRAAASRFHDVDYTALVDDPVAAVTAIHAFAGLPVGEALTASVEAKLADSPKHRWGRHVYTAEDFGLDDSTIRARYADLAP